MVLLRQRAGELMLLLVFDINCKCDPKTWQYNPRNREQGMIWPQEACQPPYMVASKMLISWHPYSTMEPVRLNEYGRCRTRTPPQ
jgi:hypothetical protein